MNKKRKGVALDFIIYFFVKIIDDDIFALAAQLAYYLILSFIPFLIFLMTLIGLSNLNATRLLEGLSALMPGSAFELVSSIISEIVYTRYSGLLGVSILLLLWTASSAFRAVIKGVNKAYDVKENRSFFIRVIIAIISTLMLAIAIIITLAMLVFGGVIGEYLIRVLPFPELINFIWNICRFIIVVVAVIMIFAAIYRYMPSKRMCWKEVFPGAIISTFLWIIVSLSFSFYINNFSNYSRLYGSLGAVFVLITWLYITSIIFILGVEINTVLINTKKINKSKLIRSK